MAFEILYADLEKMAIRTAETEYHASPITKECKLEISKKSNIPVVILETYLKTENGYPGHIRYNPVNSTWDVGPMQINNVHWKSFNKKFGIKPIDIRFNGCVNLMVGAYLIRGHLDRHTKEKITSWKYLLKALADYHSKTESVNKRYQADWVENLNTLLENK